MRVTDVVEVLSCRGRGLSLVRLPAQRASGGSDGLQDRRIEHPADVTSFVSASTGYAVVADRVL